MTKNIDLLIKRYLEIAPFNQVSSETLVLIEKALNIVLPNDFKEITKYYSGNILGTIYFFNLELFGEFNIVEQTIFYRHKIKLPFRYLPLYEESDGFIIMETQDDPRKPSPVIWCAVEDVYNLCEDKPLIYNPTIFPNFTDFFEYLLDQEEQERRATS